MNFTIMVVDTMPPAVTVPAAVTLQATSPAGAIYSFTATALDNVDGAVTPVCTPASGSTFAIGTTTVTCSATDNAGNAGSGSFAVTVVDTVKPVLLVPANIVTLTTPGGTTASVTYTASATDLGQNVVVTCSSTAGSVSSFPATQLFSAGTTMVTCVANDGRGNTATGDVHGNRRAGLRDPRTAEPVSGAAEDLQQRQQRSDRVEVHDSRRRGGIAVPAHGSRRCGSSRC